MNVFLHAPQVTAIIPTYRRPHLLRRAILSVLAQEGVRLQVCVYDNASDDETAAVVAELATEDARVIYHCHPHNIGSGENFLYGMRSVDTPFFSFLSDDDYLLPGFYSHALKALAEHNNAMCWAGVTLSVDESGAIWDARVLRWPREGLFEPPAGFMALTGGMAPIWTGIVFRSDLLSRIGYLDLGVLGPADLEYCLRMAARYSFVMEKYPAAVLTLSSHSFSATQPMSSFWPGWMRMFEKINASDDLSQEFRQEAVAALRRDGEKMLFRRGANGLASGRFDFVAAAADALAEDCDERLRACVLRTAAVVCARSALIQKGYALAYRHIERRLVNSRKDLQATYGHLLRSV